MVEARHCVVIGPVATVGAAMAVVRDAKISGAVLDVNLGGDRVWPVAAMLDERGIPYVFATGCGCFEMPPQFRSRRVIAKPVTERALCEALDAIGLGRR